MSEVVAQPRSSAAADGRSAFSMDTFDDRTFLITTGLSVAAIILATSIGPLERFPGTTNLNFPRWLLCIGVAATIVVVSEIRKAVLRRPLEQAAPPAETEPLQAAA
jgi:Ca2+-transporting ATPase